MLNYFDSIGLSRAKMENDTWHITDAALPKFGRAVSSGQVPFRVANSTEQITELGQLTRALVRSLRHPWRPLHTGGRSLGLLRAGTKTKVGMPKWLRRSIMSPPLICEPPE